MTRPRLLALFALFATTAADLPGQEPVRRLDLRDGGQLDQLFTRYGPRAGRVVVPERTGVRFQIPAGKEAGMAGYTSAFSLDGDFEVAAVFELVNVPTPTKGYGAGLGLTVDADGPDGAVTLIRGISVDRGHQFAVVRSIPGESPGLDQTRYDAWSFPASGSRGRLAIRREKAELVCLGADRPAGELRELKRVPFTDRRVRYLKLHGDCGGSPTGLTARLSGIDVQAGAVVGGLTRRELDEATSYWWWWIPVAAAALAAAAYVRARKRLADPP
jgi:hypothetical protein